MTFSIIINSDPLWYQFGAYIDSTYAKTPVARHEGGVWFEKLYARQKAGEDICLSFVRMRDRLTQKEFYGFCINDAMFFARDAGVLTAPYPRNNRFAYQAIPYDLFVGCWVHDFGTCDVFNARAERIFEGISLYGTGLRNDVRFECGEFNDPHINMIDARIKGALQPYLSDCDVHSMLGEGQIRFSRDRPRPLMAHRDQIDLEKNPEVKEDCWNLILSSVVVRTGPRFFLPQNEKSGYPRLRDRISVDSLPNSVTSHLCLRTGASYRERFPSSGSFHKAVGHNEGRAVFFYHDIGLEREWRPMPKEAVPPLIIKRCDYSDALVPGS